MYTLLADADSTVLASDAAENGDEQLTKWRLDLMYHIGGYGNHQAKNVHDKNAKEKARGPEGDEAEVSSGAHWDSSWNGQIVYTSRSDNEEVG